MAFATSRFAAAVITPRAAPAQALAAPSQRLSSGFFFVQGFAIAPRNAAGRRLLRRPASCGGDQASRAGSPISENPTASTKPYCGVASGGCSFGASRYWRSRSIRSGRPMWIQRPLS